LKKMSDNGRIINVSSDGHRQAKIDFDFIENDMNFERTEENYKYFNTYIVSKLGQIFFTKDMAEYCRLNNINVKNFSLHPGVVNSSFCGAFNQNKCVCIFLYLFYPITWYFTKTSKMGAQTTLQLCYENYDRLTDGAYYKDCALKESSALSNDKNSSDKYLKYCMNLIDINTSDDPWISADGYLKYLKEK